MQFIYTAVFSPKPDGGLSVSFPDLPGLHTHGSDLKDAMKKASDVLCMCLYDLEERELPIPNPTPPIDVKVENDSFISAVMVETDDYRRRFDKKTIKLALVMPTWLVQKAEESNIDITQLLGHSLRVALGITEDTLIRPHANVGAKAVEHNTVTGHTPVTAPSVFTPVTKYSQEPRPQEKSRKLAFLYIALFFVLFSIIGTGMYFLYINYRLPNRSVEARVLAGQSGESSLGSASAYVGESELAVAEEELIGEEHVVEESFEEEPIPVRVPRQEFLELRESFRNDDIVGRLWIENTNIDYIVVQGVDNQHYLYHDIWGNPSSAGWVFLDYLADISAEDDNLVLYAHNMPQGIMFHNLRYFRDYDFFSRHRIIHFSTLYEDYRWEVFAFYVADIHFPYTHLNFPNEDTRDFWFQRFSSASMHDSGIIVTERDRILTLSTCTNTNVDHRYVLQARLIRE